MTTNFKGSEPATSSIDGQSALFVATPVWDRNRKRSAFGGAAKRPAESRSFAAADDAPMRPALRPMGRPDADLRTRPVEPAADSPMFAARTAKARNAGGVSTITLAAAAGAILVLGGAGWFVTRNNDTIPELAPAPATTEIATAPMASAPLPVEVAANDAPPAPPVARAAPARRAAPAATSARVRPAAASAGDTGVNVSATLPEGPQPYSARNPSAAPQPVAPTAPAIVETAPAPAEAIPETPAIAPEPAPADPAAPPT